jgi:hypothetical protein
VLACHIKHSPAEVAARQECCSAAGLLAVLDFSVLDTSLEAQATHHDGSEPLHTVFIVSSAAAIASVAALRIPCHHFAHPLQLLHITQHMQR